MAVYYNMTDICYPSNVMGFWQMEEASGNIIDQTTNHFDGIVHNCTYGETGIITKSLGFLTANSSWVDCGTDAKLASNNGVSVSTWIYPIMSSVRYKPIICKENDTDTSGQNAYFSCLYEDGSDPGTLYALFFLSSGQPSVWRTELNYNQWNHIVLVFNPTSGECWSYINNVGALFTDGTGHVGATWDNPTATFRIGYNAKSGGDNGSPWYFNGSIDEPMVWNIALTSSDVSDLYSSGAPQRSGGVSYVPRQSGSCGLHIF